MSHVRIDLDERVFVAPFYADTVIAKWDIQGDQVVASGLYESRPWSRRERWKQRRKGHQYEIAVNYNSVGYRIRATVIEHGEPDTIVVWWGR